MTEKSKTIELPDFGDHRLLLTAEDPVCNEFETIFVNAAKQERIVQLDNVEIGSFWENGGIVNVVREMVARVYMKSINENLGRDGEPNGIVVDPNSWLHGFVVNMDHRKLMLARPLLLGHALPNIERLYPGIYPGNWNTPKLRRKTLWNSIKWERAAGAYGVGEFED